MNSADNHLSAEQIDSLIAIERGETEGEALQGVIEDARRHLAGCKECQQMVQMHYRIEDNLKELQVKGTASPGQDCPPIESLREVAAGIKSVQESERLLDHATNCDHCGPLLRRATEDLTTELSSDEASFLARLSTAQPAFQRELAGKLADSQGRTGARQTAALPVIKSKPRPKLKIHRWVYAAAAGLLVVATAVSWFVFRSRLASADQLIAQAYSEQRTLELRFADASQAPIRQRRGIEGSSLAKPTALLEAELLIKRQLEKTPNDPRWLAAKGRSELLEWHYEDAIRSFERALEMSPDSPNILRDLATGYFQRAEVEHRPIDYGNAIEELSRALAKQPDDPVSLFNRAILYDRMFLYDSGTKDWESYLRLDPNGPWSREARQHLDEIKKKLQHRSQLQVVPLEDPSAALTYFDERLRDKSAIHNEASAIDEQYLDLATEKWLSVLAEDIRNGRSIQESPAGRALQSFSKLWETRHGDSWLADLLQSATASGFPDAAEALSGAVAASSEGDPSLAHQRADLAVRQFERLHNRAGLVRSKLERVYALQRSLEDGKCVQSAIALGAVLEGLSYYWIQAKLMLEESACFANTAHVEEAERFVQRSREISSQREFNILSLRGLSFASDFAADKGDRKLAWEEARLGLERFWSGSFPAIRGYALCAGLGYLAEDSKQAWVAIAFWSEAVPLIEETRNRSTEGLARYRLATEEIAVGRKAEASSELERVTLMFSSSLDNPASLNYRVASEVSLAAVELSLGERTTARTRLNAIGSLVPNVDQYQTALQYYRTLGEAQILEGDWPEAEKSLHSAVAIGQRGLIAFKGDRDRLTWDEQTSDAYRSLVRLLLSQRGREEEALRIWEWYRSLPFRTSSGNHSLNEPTLAELGASPPKPGESDIKPLLSSLTQVTFLTFAALNDGVAIWAYDDRGIKFHRVSVPIEELNAASRNFNRLCADPSSDIALLRAEAKKLYAWFISPIQSSLTRGRTIWVEPDGSLSFVPFQALVDSDGSDFLAKYPLAYRASSSGTPRAQEPRLESGDEALVASSSLLTGPSSHSLPPLPDAIREASAVAARFPNHTLFLDQAVGPDVFRAELQRAALFHYAGHYLSVEGARRTEMALILSNKPASASRPTTRSDLLLRRCKLVVLSACSTGAGEKLGLFDPDGLVRPLLRSGARRVVATRWDVDSRVTAELMDNLYSALLSGQSSVDALRTASLQLTRDPRYAHPYYWAGFGVFAQD